MTNERFSGAAERNKQLIADVLRPILPASGSVLEVASGSGQHVVHFARRFPSLLWQPSDPSAEARASIEAYLTNEGLENVAAPIHLDATAQSWPVSDLAVVVAINMIHISDWAATVGLFAGAARVMPPEGVVVTYGPYRIAGEPFAPSNAGFDASLRARNPAWGVRNLEDVEGAAAAAGFTLAQRVAMPANNQTLIFNRL